MQALSGFSAFTKALREWGGLGELGALGFRSEGSIGVLV